MQFRHIEHRSIGPPVKSYEIKCWCDVQSVKLKVAVQSVQVFATRMRGKGQGAKAKRVLIPVNQVA